MAHIQNIAGIVQRRPQVVQCGESSNDPFETPRKKISSEELNWYLGTSCSRPQLGDERDLEFSSLCSPLELRGY